MTNRPHPGSRLARLERAAQTASTAQYRINSARDDLRMSRQWASYDTWFGGLFASLAKFESLDAAQQALRSVNLELERLRDQLAALDLADVGVVEAPLLHRTLDVWLDNFVSDALTQRRLVRAAARLEEVSQALVRLQDQIADMRLRAD